MELNFRSGLPVYLQIVRQVQRLAAAGRLRPGDQLPTVRELAVQLGVNFNTVARAYRLLDQVAAVSAQRGRGTYVLGAVAAPGAGAATLRRLTSQYVAAARWHKFSDAQIATALSSQLTLRPGTLRAGDNHG